MTQAPSHQPSFLSRWWIYQRERFPVVSYGVLVLVFSSAAVIYPTLLNQTRPQLHSLGVVFITFFCAFLQLRIADEFKDYEHDCQYRPQRPVPRGLIELKELRVLEIITVLIQLAVTLTLDWRLFPWLSVLWIFQTLMRWEFFVRDWLRQRSLIYLLSHNLVLPMMALYGIMASTITLSPFPLHPQIIAFLLLSSAHGLLIEIGRKVRAPEQEIPGGETYSQVWGMRRSVYIWLSVGLASTFLTAIALYLLKLMIPAILLLLICSSGIWVASYQFLQQPTAQTSKQIYTVSALWMMVSYLNIGVIPWVMQR
ncbi:MAG: UbiA family prenyltransferase [Cyanobacteria bacterium P01_G01_bin.54]